MLLIIAVVSLFSPCLLLVLSMETWKNPNQTANRTNPTKPEIEKPEWFGLVWFIYLKTRHKWFGLIFLKTRPTRTMHTPRFWAFRSINWSWFAFGLNWRTFKVCKVTLSFGMISLNLRYDISLKRTLFL